MALLVIVLPALLLANVLQAFRYSQLEQSLRQLERQQQVLLEQNKRAILAISVLSSPERIGTIRWLWPHIGRHSISRRESLNIKEFPVQQTEHTFGR